MFDSNPSVYDAFIEIEGSQGTRQGMVDSVSGDDGSGGTSDPNNREYGCLVCNDGGVENLEPGPVIDPSVDCRGHIYYDRKEGTKSVVHSHQSGVKTTVDRNGNIYESKEAPSPSPKDVRKAGNMTNYVIGKGNGTVYIYNRNGVQATIPLKNFVNFK